MALEEVVAAGVQNALARKPVVDRASIEQKLRQANRSVARRIGRIEWVGSLEAYIRRSAELLVDGWTADSDDPLTPPQSVGGDGDGLAVLRLDRLLAADRWLWSAERAAHNTSRLTPSRRLPVYLNAIEMPALASEAAGAAVATAAVAATVPPPRRHGFATVSYWKYSDAPLGADAGDRRAAVPRPDRGVLRCGPLCRDSLAATRRDADVPDRTAPAPPRLRPATGSTDQATANSTAHST